MMRWIQPARARTVLAAAAFAAVLASGAARSALQPFGEWLEGVRSEAAGRGISPGVIDAALSDVAPIERIIELDRRQPESRITFTEYLRRTTPRSRVREGQALLDRHRALLDRVAAAYGVQPRFIVALWGMETSYGANTGGFPVIDALATLAHDGRRSDYFRGELMDALEILDGGHIAVADMQGSWAGAMGQSQFMPSSFLKFAQDFDGDGRRDIWTTLDDVFASAANYLSEAGWTDEETWGREVRLPRGFDGALVGLEVTRSLAEWGELGVRRKDGSALPDADIGASVVAPDGTSGPAYLVYGNYRAIMQWNRSTYFATSVGILSDRIGGCVDGPRGLSCAR
jgi:membrane-bound lytic murein transglycosylase B